MSDMIDAINWNGHCTLFNTIFQQQKVFLQGLQGGSTSSRRYRSGYCNF